MALKVAINGFGRIGRLVFRAGASNPNIEFVGINDLVPPNNLAYLLKHDSTHGHFKGTVEAKEDGIVVNGKFIKCVSVRNPAETTPAEILLGQVPPSAPENPPRTRKWTEIPDRPRRARIGFASF